MRQIALKRNTYNEAIRDVLVKRGISIRPRRQFMMDQTYFERVDSQEKAQILGFIWADGCLHDSQNRLALRILINDKDRDYLEWIRTQFKATYRIYEGLQTGGKHSYVSLNISDPKPIQDIQRLGIFPRKSLHIGFPTVEQVPPEFIPAFVRGVFEGDGCIHIVKGANCAKALFVATHEFNEALKFILAQQGIDSVIRERKDAKGHNWCVLEITRLASIFRLMGWMYAGATYRMERKWVLFQQFRARYDANGKFIETEEWKAKRRAKLAKVRASWTLSADGMTRKKASLAKVIKKTFTPPFHIKSPSGQVYFTNVLSDFAREIGLPIPQFGRLVRREENAKSYKGWTHPTDLEIASARAAGTLIERLYRVPAAPVEALPTESAPIQAVA